MEHVLRAKRDRGVIQPGTSSRRIYSARQQSRLFDRENPQLRRSPTQTGFAEIVGDDFPILPRAADSRLLFLAEFLESGIGAQWIPERIEA